MYVYIFIDLSIMWTKGNRKFVTLYRFLFPLNSTFPACPLVGFVADFIGGAHSSALTSVVVRNVSKSLTNEF